MNDVYFPSVLTVLFITFQGANTSDKEDDRDVSDTFKKLDIDLDEYVCFCTDISCVQYKGVL